MHICCKLIAFGVAAIALSAARGGVPTEWQVRIGPKATVYQAERYHGDALDLRATLTSGGLPLVYQGSARLYAQTNGMGALWWDLAPVTVASNVLAATWRPEFDTGADVVDVFLGAPCNFQAHARIRFLPSPGPAPNSLPMPTPVLDFSAVELRNISALTNGWSFGSSADLTPATNYTDRALAAFATTGTVDRAYTAYSASTADGAMSATWAGRLSLGGSVGTDNFTYEGIVNGFTAGTNYTDAALGAFASTGAVARANVYGTPTRWTDATGCVWEVVTGWRVYTNGIVAVGWTAWGREVDAGPDGYSYELLIGPDETEGIPIASATFPSSVQNWADEYEVTYDLDYDSYGLTYGDAIRAVRGGTNFVGRVALMNDIPDTAAIQEDIEGIRTESQLIYRLYSGSNVVAEVTNYNSQVHAPTLRLMQLNESNEYVTVWTETNGLARTLREATNYTDRAIADYAAPRAWSRTTSGLGAEAPANTTWISTPTTVIAGGFEYAKFVDTYGEVWVLSSNGMAAEFNPDTNAYFRITADDGTPVFSVEKTDAQLVGANAAGITVGESTITIPVPVVSSTAPTMYWRSSLSSGDWADESAVNPNYMSVDWTGGPGSWVCTISFDGSRPPMMFFKFNFLQEGAVVIRNNATTDLSSGIWVNGTKFVPSVSGNNLIWTKQ